MLRFLVCGVHVFSKSVLRFKTACARGAFAVSASCSRVGQIANCAVAAPNVNDSAWCRMQGVRIGLATMGGLIARTSNFAKYLGISEETVRRMMDDRQLLVERATQYAKATGGDPAKAIASIRARLRSPVARGFTDIGLWFAAFAPQYLTDKNEIGCAVTGIPTWGPAADIARVWDVSAKTLSRHARPLYDAGGGVSAIRLDRALLIRVPEIAGKYARRRAAVPRRLRFLAKIAEEGFPLGRCS